jgi:hypothetical protein
LTNKPVKPVRHSPSGVHSIEISRSARLLLF